jgi:hypothetical protein
MGIGSAVPASTFWVKSHNQFYLNNPGSWLFTEKPFLSTGAPPPLIWP